MPLSLAGETPTDGLIEVERPGGNDVAGANDQDRFLAVAMAIRDPLHPAMSGRDPALTAALEDGMRGDHVAIFEDPDLVGQRVDLDDPLPGRIGDAVEIAGDAHHAFMGDAPFQLEH